tara:strand:- start:1097 stop:2503 length:1407 start_codon:yes stop_codon:yes gene_type:complete
MNNLFSDNMVLQRNSSVNIWGKSNPNQILTVYSSWNNKSVKTKSNSSGEWILKIKTDNSIGPYELTISTKNETKVIRNILFGEVWFASGQSNMEMPLDGFFGEPIYGSQDIIGKSINSNIRLLTVERNYTATPVSNFEGKWQETRPESSRYFSAVANFEGKWQESTPESSRYFSAVAYSFAKYIHESLGVPVGIISSAWGGTPAEAWAEKSFLDKEFKPGIIINNSDEKFEEYNPGYLFNAMLKPLIPFTLRGGIWYQGENNRERAKNYSKLMQVMVASWRDRWGLGDFPFYFVQIAPFSYNNPNESSSAELRDAQLDAMRNIKNSGMVSTVDIGDLYSIHPPEKVKIGNRLAYWALNQTYGYKSITPSGPIPNSAKVEESKVIISFDYADNGIYNFNGSLKDFEIAGEDEIFYEAEAKIYGESIIVESSNVSNPRKVRYGWKNYFEATLFNIEGLPATSFYIKDLIK